MNSWVAVYDLELELTVRTPTDSRTRAFLHWSLSRAHKRMTDAARELARVSKLQVPTILAQLNVAAIQSVVNQPATSGAT